MSVRPERSTDVEAIADVVARAFDGTVEAALVAAIRGSEDYLPDLSLVAEVGDAVVGHIMLSRARVGEQAVVTLSPLAVAPEHQRRGIGTALTTMALARAERDGWPVCVVLGIPAYYPRFGFTSARAMGIEPPVASWDEAFMAKPLRAYDPQVRGVFSYGRAFHEVEGVM